MGSVPICIPVTKHEVCFDYLLTDKCIKQVEYCVPMTGGLGGKEADP